MRLVARFRQRKDADQGRPLRPTLPPRPTLMGTPGTDIAGVRPDGTGIEMAVAGGSVALLFLTGSCYGCRVLWEGAASGGASGPNSIPTVIVTPSPTTEDARTVAALAPREGITVVMSSDVWHAYRVERAPWCVVVAAGTVVADGMAPGSWSELAAEVAATAAPGGGPATG